jgi:long-subunit acyl-CoA synthetase (AMP-forming)
MSSELLFLEKFYQNEQDLKNQVYLKQPRQGLWVEYTWQQVGLEARKFAQALKNLNLPDKSKIAILSKNCAHWIMTDLGIMMAGHVSVPLYPTLNAQTIDYILEHCDAKLMVVGKLDDWQKQSSELKTNITKVAFPLWPHEGIQDWEDFIINARPLKDVNHPDPDDEATIIYTSGTTGQPKGVLHTYHSMCINCIEALKYFKINQDDRFISYLPLSHVAERLLIEQASIYSGGTVFFAESLETFKNDLQSASPTLFLAVPRIWLKFQQGILEKIPQKKLNLFLKIPFLAGMIKKKIKTGLGLQNVKYAYTGAAAISKDLLVWFDRIGIKIYEVYGMTENFSVSHMNRPGMIKYGTVGPVCPHTEMKLLDSGEVLVKNQAHMKGYFNEDKKTKEIIDTEGWLHTGDKGEVDADGYFKITGRVKDLFKTSKGKYVAPVPIEKLFVFSQHIEQVCITGNGLPGAIALITLSEHGYKQNKNTVVEDFKFLQNEVNQKVEQFEQVLKLIVVPEQWTVNNGMITPTLKLKRNIIENHYKNNYDQWVNASEKIIWV